jgi:hypothetical protein
MAILLLDRPVRSAISPTEISLPFIKPRGLAQLNDQILNLLHKYTNGVQIICGFTKGEGGDIPFYQPTIRLILHPKSIELQCYDGINYQSMAFRANGLHPFNSVKLKRFLAPEIHEFCKSRNIRFIETTSN